MSQIDLVTAGDEVMAGCLIPSECVQNNVWGEVHVISDISMTWEDAMLYGADGWLIPDVDPDSSEPWDEVWDKHVDKAQDVSSGGFDLDIALADTGPVWEPGEVNLARIMDMSVLQDDHQWFRRRKMVTFASSPSGYEVVAAGADKYIPVDVFKVRSRKNIMADVMSVSLFGLSLPANNAVTTAEGSTPANEKEWMQIKYLEVVLEQAWMHLVGLVEAGAETPWEDASLLIQSYLAPDVYEANAGSFGGGGGLTAYSTMTFDITVPGRREIKQLSAAS